jgi:hypothetical protein
MTGIVEPCEPIRAFLRARRGEIPDLESRLPWPDDGAEYVRTIRIDLDEVPITVATPGDSRNRKALSSIGEVPIHNVVIASCTGGSLSDLRAAARVLEGRHFKEGVRVTVTPSSADVYAAADGEGILARFSALGAIVTAPGCGSCIGNGPGIPLAGETTASTTNRNFDRRMGAPGPVYLVSPAVAAASAVTGLLNDPRTLWSVRVEKAMTGGTLAIVLALAAAGPPVLPPEASASVPPPPPPAPVRTASLGPDIVDPFSGRGHSLQVRSIDLRDPFDVDAPVAKRTRRPPPPPPPSSAQSFAVESTPELDLVDPFADAANAHCAARLSTRSGVPIQRPRTQSRQPCAHSDAPLRDPFPRKKR